MVLAGPDRGVQAPARIAPAPVEAEADIARTRAAVVQLLKSTLNFSRKERSMTDYWNRVDDDRTWAEGRLDGYESEQRWQDRRATPKQFAALERRGYRPPDSVTMGEDAVLAVGVEGADHVFQSLLCWLRLGGDRQKARAHRPRS
jgi:hypothetical protein